MSDVSGRLLFALLGIAALAMVACGEKAQPEAVSAGALTTGAVQATQTGNAAAQLQAASVSYRVDNSGSLIVLIQVTSTASGPQTIMARASLYNASGQVIGDAVGGAVSVPAGATVPVQLTGPPPSGTITSATFELSTTPAPTPILNTPIPTATYTP